MTQLIQVPAIGATPQIAISQDAVAFKVEYLTKSDPLAALSVLDDDQDRDLCIALAGQIKRHLTDVEKARKELKDPFYRTGQEIDKAAATHVAELIDRLTRLNNLAGAYEAEKQRIARIAEQQRAAEEARLAREKMAAEREAARLEEEARKKAEAAAAKGRELTDAQKAKTMEVLMDLSEKSELIEVEQLRLHQERALATQFIAESKPTGAALRTELEVVVNDIRALYAKEPACVKLTADISMIKAFHKAGRELPGVTVTERPVFATRAAR
jgi:hypothetical protein